MYTRPSNSESDVRLVFSNCYHTIPGIGCHQDGPWTWKHFQNKNGPKPAPKPAHVQTFIYPCSIICNCVCVRICCFIHDLPSLHFPVPLPNWFRDWTPSKTIPKDSRHQPSNPNPQARLNYLLINRNKSGSSASISGSKSASHAASALPSQRKVCQFRWFCCRCFHAQVIQPRCPAPLDEMTFEEKRQLSEDVSNLPKKTWCASSKSFKNACQICIPTAIRRHRTGHWSLGRADPARPQSYIWECLNPARSVPNPMRPKRA